MAGFFRTESPKRFNVEPRYWNPEKEELDARIKRAKAEAGVCDEDGNAIRRGIAHGDFHKGFSKGRREFDLKKERSKSTKRFFLILALLLACLFFMFH